MPYLPPTVPGPVINEINAPFWESCRQHRLSFQECGNCRRVVHPPLPVCPECQSRERQWREVRGEGVVFSFTWAHTAAHESVRESLPYNIVLVEFPELPGVRLVSNVVNVRPGELAIGDRLALLWETDAAGQSVPRFRKVEPGEAGA